MRRILCLVAIASIALALQDDAAAKTDGKSVIHGVVTAGNGVALNGVKIIAFNLDTGVPVETKSDSKGRYELKDLPKGDYELTAIAEGYDMFGSDEIKVDAKKPVTYDIKMIELFERSAPSEENP